MAIANLSAETEQVELPVASARRSAGRDNGKPRQRDADQTRADIVEAALAEFALKGLAGARVDEIARKTATSKHMIYYYFGSKEGLYRAVLESAYQNFRFAEQAVDYDDLDPIDAMQTLVGLSFDFRVSNPQFVRIIMGENLNSGEHIHQLPDVVNPRAILTTLESIVDRGVALGQFREDIDILQLHMTITSLCFYFVANRYSFGHVFGIDMGSPEMIATRRVAIIDAVLGCCLARVG